MVLHRFERYFSVSGHWVPSNLWRAVAGCGGLWRPVAGCGGKLWPLYTTMLGPRGLQAAWMAGCLDGRLAGWLDGGGGHHHCNLALSSSRRVGGFNQQLGNWIFDT